jgi:hypothetical protein
VSTQPASQRKILAEITGSSGAGPVSKAHSCDGYQLELQLLQSGNLMHTQPATATTPDRAGWGELPRAVATVLLAVYLVGLGLTVAGNSGSGGSLLIGVIKGRLFSPWLVPAWLDLGFDHPVTYGQQADADHRLEVRPHGDEIWQAGPGTNTGGPRAARWQRLLRAVVASEQEPGREGLLPAGFGTALFAACGSDDVDIRILIQPRPERQLPLALADPVVAYQARLRRLSSGELQLIKTEAHREVAPVAPAGETP